MKYSKKIFCIGVLFILIFINLTSLLACKETELRISNKLLKSTDLPQGWLVFRETSGEEWGGKSFNIGFEYGTELEDPAIGHQLILYSDAISAIKGFHEYSDFIYTETWTNSQEINFDPINSDDLVNYKCVDLIINTVPVKNCLIMQQHDHYLSVIDIRMGEPYLTFEVLNSILGVIDNKLNE